MNGSQKPDIVTCSLCHADVDLDEPYPEDRVVPPRTCSFCGLCLHTACFDRISNDELACRAASGQLSRQMSSLFGSREAGDQILHEGLGILGEAYDRMEACFLCLSGMGDDLLF